jgi:hypothetical protein
MCRNARGIKLLAIKHFYPGAHPMLWQCRPLNGQIAHEARMQDDHDKGCRAGDGEVLVSRSAIDFGGTMTRASQVLGMAILATGLAAGVVAARETAVTCVNPASGATWQIHIDFSRHTVDSNSATISGTEISWRDAGGSNYTLDRRSGALTAITASSTGGYFLHDRCKLS